MFSSGDVIWAASECERQQTTPFGVPRLLDALQYARYASERVPDMDDMMYLAWLIEPKLNGYWRRGQDLSVECNFRRTSVVIMGGGATHHWQVVPQAVERLFEIADFSWLTLETDAEVYDNHDAKEFCRQLMIIHPWADGNGRTGAVLYNWLTRQLSHPVPMPEFQFS
jgi:hypothetical protein